MGGRAESVDFNRWIRGEAEKIAAEMGIPEIPMRDSHFNFYGYMHTILAAQGLRGQNLYEGIHDVLQRITFNHTTGEPGRIYRFPSWYAKNPGRGFDEYFALNANRQAITDARWRGRKKRKMNHLPIGLGREGDETQEISSDALESGGLRPDEIVEGEDLDRRWEEIKREVSEMLLRNRNGPLMAKIWNDLNDGKILAEITDEMNYLALDHPEFRPPRGPRWSEGALSRLRDKIYQFVRDRYGREGFGATASRVSERILFRAKHYQPGTDFGRLHP